MAHLYSIFHSTVSPDPCYHCPLILSVVNGDITLRKYQLHCLQYHMPVWTHLLLLVGEQQRETGTETERDKREKGDGELKWRSNLALAGAVFRTEDLSSTIVTKINIFL